MLYTKCANKAMKKSYYRVGKAALNYGIDSPVSAELAKSSKLRIVLNCQVLKGSDLPALMGSQAKSNASLLTYIEFIHI